MDKFFLFDSFVCFRKGTIIKQYFDLKNFDNAIRNNIIETLNDHYYNLSVVKMPSNDDISFLIDGKPYLEQKTNSNNQKETILHNFITQQDHNVLPVLTKQHHYFNIFNDNNENRTQTDEYYIIKCDTHMGCYVVDKHNHIASHTNHIFEKYNVFVDWNILVDIDSFREGGYVKDNGIVDLDSIRKLISSKYRISYVNKILLKTDLLSKDFITFITTNQCKMGTVSYNPSGVISFFIWDNLRQHYELNVMFNDEEKKSKFSFIKKL